MVLSFNPGFPFFFFSSLIPFLNFSTFSPVVHPSYLPFFFLPSFFQYSLPKEERRNISKLYNKMTIGELQTMVPEIPWLEYINRVLHPFFVVSYIGGLAPSLSLCFSVSAFSFVHCSVSIATEL